MTIADLVNADPRLQRFPTASGGDTPGLEPVMATPAAVVGFHDANKAAVAGAGAFGALFGAGVVAGD